MRGATRASWQDHNPRELVKRIMEKYPNDTPPQIRARVHTALQTKRDAKYLEAFIDYTIDNALAALNTNPDNTTRDDRRKQDEKYREEVARRAKKIKDQIINIVFMEFMTPFGKPLGQCTGEEGRALTDWFSRFFDGIADDQRLCDHRTEEDLRRIFINA